MTIRFLQNPELLTRHVADGTLATVGGTPLSERAEVVKLVAPGDVVIEWLREPCTLDELVCRARDVFPDAAPEVLHRDIGAALADWAERAVVCRIE